MTTRKTGLWVSPNSFVEFAENSKSISTEFATREKSLDYYALSQYLPNPDPVLKRLGKDISVYRDLCSDAHVASCVEQRQAGVRCMLWEIDRGKSKSRQAKFVQQIFADLNVDRIIAEILDAVLFGFQPMEIMWAADGGAWTIGDIVGKPPDWFVYSPTNELRLRTRTNTFFGEEIPPMKIAVARHRSSYNNPYGVPGLTPCFWPVTFKKGGWKYWAKFTEKFGMPWVVGKHRKGATKAEKDDMLDKLERMVQDALCVIPEDASVDTLEPKGGTASVDIYSGIMQFANAEISKALVGQTLTTEVTGNGSYAASKTHGEVRGDIVESDKRMVEAMMNQVIQWIVEMNFGDNAECPRFIMYQEDDVDLDLSVRDKNLLDTGRIKFTKEYYQRSYGFTDAEFEVIEPTTPPTFPPAAPGEAPAGGPAFAEANPTSTSAAPTVKPLDQMVARAEAEATDDALIDPIAKLMEECSTLEELRDRILDAYQDMDASTIGATMEQAMTAAELMGRYQVKTQAKK